jgi:hypothetical protein
LIHKDVVSVSSWKMIAISNHAKTC